MSDFRDTVSSGIDSKDELDEAPCPECGKTGKVYSNYGDEGDISCEDCGLNRGPLQ